MSDSKSSPKRKTTLQYVLLSLIPYTEPNLKLTFHPNEFFTQLEYMSGSRSTTLRAAYGRAKSRNFIKEKDGKIVLSLEARQQIQPFIAKKIKHGNIMVIFDIPTEIDYKRRKLRSVLKYLGFKQVQQSVWICQYDNLMIVKETVKDLGVEDFVEIYEAAKA